MSNALIYLKVADQSLTMPGDWSAMKLGQFLGVIDAQNDAAVLSALTGLSIVDLRALPEPRLSAVIPELLSYLTNPPDFAAMPVPKQVEVNGKTIKPITDLGSQTTYGQTLDITSELRDIQEAGKAVNPITTAKLLLCVYLYPAVTGLPYTDIQLAYQIEPDVLSLPLLEAMPLSAFFLSSFLRLEGFGRLSWTKQNSTRPKRNYWKWLSGWFPTWPRLTGGTKRNG